MARKSQSRYWAKGPLRVSPMLIGPGARRGCWGDGLGPTTATIGRGVSLPDPKPPPTRRSRTTRYRWAADARKPPSWASSHPAGQPVLVVSAWGGARRSYPQQYAFGKLRVRQNPTGARHCSYQTCWLVANRSTRLANRDNSSAASVMPKRVANGT